jgi:hypothetical protein
VGKIFITAAIALDTVDLLCAFLHTTHAFVSADDDMDEKCARNDKFVWMPHIVREAYALRNV